MLHYLNYGGHVIICNDAFKKELDEEFIKLLKKEFMSKHYYSSEDNCVKRLLEEYEKHGTLYVAFDFDNTIYDYHNKGIDCSSVISLLQDCTQLGFQMILFTCEQKVGKLREKEKFCKNNGIEVHWVNRSPILDFTTKPYYSILLDDRAGLQSAMQILERVVTHLKNKK